MRLPLLGGLHQYGGAAGVAVLGGDGGVLVINSGNNTKMFLTS